MKLLIIIPTFNEVENIERIIESIAEKTRNVDILVVDDGSVDGTVSVVSNLAKSYDHIHALLRTEKTGLGDAYRAGFSWAISNNYYAVAQMDADGSHRVEDLISLIAASENYDVVIGSRWVSGGSIRNWPWSRFALSKLGNLYGRIMLRIPIRDATAGFRIYSKKALILSKMLESHSQGYVFQIENSLRITEAKLRVIEVPITFIERKFGESKMSGSIVKEAMLKVTLWGLKGRLLKRKIFIK
ncbi:MAG: polyprenol monophosphomannose synthase [Candidatus Nanopelagicales bacterium]